jgi:catechol 2,3-dioxygenase-like lactoylglutathione lyase family enzyme
MPVGEVLEGGGVIAARHCFVRPGGDAPRGGCTSSRQRGVTLPQFPDGLPGLRTAGFLPGALQHVAFALPDAAAGEALRRRLAAHGVEATAHGRVGPLANLLFLDPHGLLLEATWPREP